jgi:hypothetical protein
MWSFCSTLHPKRPETSDQLSLDFAGWFTRYTYSSGLLVFENGSNGSFHGSPSPGNPKSQNQTLSYHIAIGRGTARRPSLRPLEISICIHPPASDFTPIPLSFCISMPRDICRDDHISSCPCCGTHQHTLYLSYHPYYLYLRLMNRHLGGVVGLFQDDAAAGLCHLS